MTKMVHSCDMDYFKNPMKLPIDKLDLVIEVNGETQKVPALSKFWTEKKQFLYYHVPNIYSKDGKEIVGAKDYWLETINYMIKDLEWLLCLSFHRFWSNIIYNKSIINILVLFLQDCPTFYTLDKFPNDKKMRESLEQLRRNVLIIFARIVTNKESSDAFFTLSTHGEIIYKEFLITAPIMLDLCQLYGRENQKIVEKILQSAIKAHPGYENDLREAVEFIVTFITTAEQNFEQSEILNSTTMEEYEHIVIELLDMSTNAEIFLTVYPHAAEFFSNHIFLTRIVSLYDNMISELYKKLHDIGYNEENLIKYTELKHYLDVTRIELLKIFRVASYKDIAWILEQPDPKKVDDATDRIGQFLDYLITGLSEKNFTRDYQQFYSILDDLDLVGQITDQIDPVKKELLINLVTMADNEKLMNIPDQIPEDVGTCSNGYEGFSSFPEASSGTTTNGKTEEELVELISSVKQILDNLGEGFIERCLKYYNYDQDAMINAYCEDALPAELRELDKTLPYIPADPMEKSAAVDQTLGFERLDEVYQKYGLIDDDYDDEYDDTYDSQNNGVRVLDDAEEMDRPFTTPRVLNYII
ncbi:hypothetical protein HCN44_006297 [Aphidius gifuensis]|uniref:CUE domain-containing protein n=1 Tax=Aphidius gifuensis TaxID=684658 RepID=A0A834XVD5_APHGI|nr:hypothetical protein HCN44_006297 [Aphidius gifuensis]